MPTDRDYYLTKAAQLRRIAGAVSDEKMADELERLAKEFVERANAASRNRPAS